MHADVGPQCSAAPWASAPFGMWSALAQGLCAGSSRRFLRRRLRGRVRTDVGFMRMVDSGGCRADVCLKGSAAESNAVRYVGAFRGGVRRHLWDALQNSLVVHN